MHILILGGDADGNLGDRAILQAMCAALRDERPDVELTVVSADADRARRDYGAAVVPRGLRGLRRLWTVARRSDLVIVGGGGLFQDDDSLVKMPYWAMRLLLVRSACRRIVGYALGVGPLRAGTSRLSARLAFAMMETVTVRDPRARAVAQPLTRKHVDVLPDPALLLAPLDRDAARRWLETHDVPVDGRPLIGVAARRWFPARPRLVPNKLRSRWRNLDIDRSEEARGLTRLIGRVLADLVERRGAFILFLPTYTLRHEGDDRVCERIAAHLPPSSAMSLRIDDPALYKGVAGHLSVLLGGRMHPTIFAASVGTPIVGLAYNQKFHGFFELLGNEHRIMDVDSLVLERRSETLRGMLEEALGDRDDLQQRAAALAERLRAFNHALLTERVP